MTATPNRSAALMFALAVVAGHGVPVAHGQNSAPSSHLVFDDNFEGDLVINEVRVPKDGEALYTYYEALGWRGRAAGYAGIQSHPRGRNYIFSIWDHKEHTVPIRAVHRGPGTLTEKFGGEGTGLKSWNFELGWETDTWYSLVSRCWPVGDHTFYGYWVRSGKTKQWVHLVTMDVAAKQAWFQGGTDAFLEDWLATGERARTTNLRGGWKRKVSGQWHAFGSGRYSVNHWDLDPGKRSYNYRNHWNGGVAKDAAGTFYFMTAGGRETKPAVSNPSKHAIQRSDARPQYPSIRIDSAQARWAADGKIVITWENDATTLPQFGFGISAFDRASGKEQPVAQLQEVSPHGRSAELEIPETARGNAIVVHLGCRDILDNESTVLTLKPADAASQPATRQ